MMSDVERLQKIADVSREIAIKHGRAWVTLGERATAKVEHEAIEAFRAWIRAEWALGQALAADAAVVQ